MTARDLCAHVLALSDRLLGTHGHTAGQTGLAAVHGTGVGRGHGGGHGLVTVVQELDGGAVAVHIDDGPEGATRLAARNEDSLLLAVDAKVDISGGSDVVEEDVVALTVSLVEGLDPEAGLVGEVRARVLGQVVALGCWVADSEAESDDAAPVVGDVAELDADALVDSHGPGTECDAFAEALDTLGHPALLRQPDVIAMHLVERQRRQIVGTGDRCGISCRWNGGKTRAISIQSSRHAGMRLWMDGERRDEMLACLLTDCIIVCRFPHITGLVAKGF